MGPLLPPYVPKPASRRSRWEAAGRHALHRLVVRLAAPRAGAPPAWGAGPRRVLFLRHDAIGDMVMSTGVMRAIAHSHPALTLDVLASPANAAVLAGAPFVGEVLVLHPGRLAVPRLWRALRRRRYDAVIDGLVLRRTIATRTMLLMAATGARHRVGVGGWRPNAALYTIAVAPPRPDAHHVEYLAALARPFGVDPAGADVRPRLFLTAAELARAEDIWHRLGADAAPERLLVNLSASGPARRWPDDAFVAAIRGAREHFPGLAVAVVSMPNERPAAAAVAAAVGGAAPPTPGVRDAFALVATAGLVLTPDTSVAHAASAYRTPTVVLMPSHMAQFTPWRTPGEAIFSPGARLASIPPARVAAALARALAALDAAAVRAPPGSPPGA